MKKYKCVLLVDDNELDLFVGKAIIEYSEVTKNLIMAKNGIDAINKLVGNYLNNQSLPELILVDIVMPMMGGIRLIEEIIGFPGYARGNCKIVVLTADLENNDKQVLENLGVTDILLKPLDKTEFLGILSSEK